MQVRAALFLPLLLAPVQAKELAFAPHPRLLATAADFARLKARLGTDPVPTAWYRKLKKEADKDLALAPARYELRDGVRLLSVSREVLRRVQVLALAYRMEGDPKYLERAWAELSAAADFPDWHPAHFLDVAELTAAFGLGYDWLYEDLSPERRSRLREAIRRKGLEPGLAEYRRGKGWPLVDYNWNLVCNGGLSLGALAIGDEEPALAKELLFRARASLPHALVSYAPDGAWNESPGYWEYGTSYLVELVAGLETALGTDWDLRETTGLADTGDFALAVSGPGPYQFAFGDIGSTKGHATDPVLWFLARTYHKPAYGAARKADADLKPAPLDCLWYDPALVGSLDGLPLAQRFRTVELATFRASWSDPDALYAALKGTSAAGRNHTDLDGGTFFIGCYGEPWITELGSDNYNLPGYFSMDPKKADNRWNYYRTRAEGQNTLVINPGPGPDQVPAAAAPMIAFHPGPAEAWAVVDLGAAYPNAQEARRGLRFLGGRGVLVQDELRLKQPGEIYWFAHLPAKVQVDLAPDQRSALLSIPGLQGRMEVRLQDPAGGLRLELAPAAPLPTSPYPAQGANEGFRKLVIHTRDVRELRFGVAFTPLPTTDAAPQPAPALVPLAQWRTGE